MTKIHTNYFGIKIVHINIDKIKNDEKNKIKTIS
jgi:hypothetical protein